jgi:hypothetical protein
MHGCSREPNYAFTFAKADNPYDKMSVEEIKEIIPLWLIANEV